MAQVSFYSLTNWIKNVNSVQLRVGKDAGLVDNELYQRCFSYLCCLHLIVSCHVCRKNCTAHVNNLFIVVARDLDLGPYNSKISHFAFDGQKLVLSIDDKPIVQLDDEQFLYQTNCYFLFASTSNFRNRKWSSAVKTEQPCELSDAFKFGMPLIFVP